jgi:hypothetical protein
MSEFMYVARLDATAVSTARTLVQLNAPSSATLEIIRAWVQFASTTSTVIDVRAKRVSTAGTGTSFTPVQLNGRTLAAGATATVNHTAEGTIGDVLWRETVNYLSGWLYLPVPEERWTVPPSGRLAIDLPSAPGASVTITAGIVWHSIG